MNNTYNSFYIEEEELHIKDRQLSAYLATRTPLLRAYSVPQPNDTARRQHWFVYDREEAEHFLEMMDLETGDVRGQTAALIFAEMNLQNDLYIRLNHKRSVFSEVMRNNPL